jgi:hypothetical protein
MKTVSLLGLTTPLNLSESWGKDLTVLVDRPLSGAFYGLEAQTGEAYLDELPPFLIHPAKLAESLN